MGASYNPRTGTYARGAAAYGPYGSRAAGQAYNPRTGTYAQTRQGSNVYGNWGSSSVQRGDDWAQSAHRTNYRTDTRTTGVRNDDGAGAVTRTGPDGRSTVARTEGGDVYAGRDGNVYRRGEGGGWEQSNGSGGWTPTDGRRAQQARDKAASRPTDTNRTGQLDRDRNARVQGNQRTTNRSGWQSQRRHSLRCRLLSRRRRSRAAVGAAAVVVAEALAGGSAPCLVVGEAFDLFQLPSASLQLVVGSRRRRR